MTLPVNHPFDQESYERCNKPAFEALRQHFSLLTVELREEDYGIDADVFIEASTGQKRSDPIAKLELEVKSGWQGVDFPFADVNFLAKKQKHIRQNAGAFWVLFNRDLTNCGIIPFSRILSCELSVIRCRDSYDDFFYRIPKEEMVWGIDNVERYLIYKAFEAYNQNFRVMFNKR